MKLALILFAGCLLMTGCVFRNVNLPPGRDPMHRVLSDDQMIAAGVPLRKANSMIGSNPAWFPTKQEAARIQQCVGCHK